MPEDKLKFLGDRIRSARKDCGLTQQALADQADLAVKTIQDVERGRKNTTYETLCQLIERLGISPNSLFPSQMSPEDEAIQRFIGKFRACPIAKILPKIPKLRRQFFKLIPFDLARLFHRKIFAGFH